MAIIEQDIAPADYSNADVVATAERLIERHGHDEAWESICELGAATEAEMDERRWVQGDLAALIGKSYGDDLIGEFARRCKVAKATMKERRQVSEFYEKDARASFSGSTIGYTHFRTAMKLKTPALALDWLRLCQSEGYTADEAAYRLKKLLNGGDNVTAKLIDTETVIKSLRGCDIGFEVSPEQLLKVLYSYDNGLPVRLMIVGEPEPEPKEAQSA